MHMQTKKLFVIAILLMSSSSSNSYYEKASKSGPGVMNGIKFDDYKDFDKKWKLVTVRYRQDSHEMRFTYANDIAWKEMQSLKPNYNDGAIFAKIGFITEQDPAFPSSEVPSGTKRYQFMVKDKNKYKSTEGWGYALFTDEGGLFKEDLAAKTVACAACHALVPERNFVFSRPMRLQFESVLSQLNSKKILDENLPFIEKPAKEFSKGFQDHLSVGATLVNSLDGPLKKNAFSGTLDEIIPVLLEKAKASGRSATLYLNDKNYSLVSPHLKTADCEDEKTQFSIVVMFNQKLVRKTSICK